MRNISFAMTTASFHDRSKTVTRRLGWIDAKPGQLLLGVVKGMGLKKGESPVPLALICIVDVRREPLSKITKSDVVKEGFPELSVSGFVRMFCDSHPSCHPDSVVTRIEFRFVPGGRFDRPTT